MRKNKRYQKETFCCAECGKNQSKYREFIKTYLCNACYSKLKIEELELIEKNNSVLFNIDNLQENVVQQEEEILQLEELETKEQNEKETEPLQN